MKTYTATAGFRVDGRVRIESPSPDGRVVIYFLRQLSPRHSPDGHAWGYGGSGPAQLALDLLTDVYGKEPVVGLYQDFKFDVIAKLDPDKGWTMTEEVIRDWVGTRGGFLPAARQALQPKEG